MSSFANALRMIRSITGNLALEIFLSASPFNRSSIGGINFLGWIKRQQEVCPYPRGNFWVPYSIGKEETRGTIFAGLEIGILQASKGRQRRLERRKRG